MIIINDKEHRNIQEQVQKNMEDIAELKEAGSPEYTAGTGIDITSNVISIDNTVVATKSDLPNMNNYVSKANLTDYSINHIIVGNSEIDNDNADLRAVYSQDVKSEVSLDPTSTIIRTMSGTDTSTIGLSATEIDVTTPMFKYGTSEVATKNDLNAKQDTLVSGTNIKTINNNSILGDGNLNVTNVMIIDGEDTTIDLDYLYDLVQNEKYDIIVREDADGDGTVFNYYYLESTGTNSNKTRFEFNFYSTYLNAQGNTATIIKWQVNNYTDVDTVTWENQVVLNLSNSGGGGTTKYLHKITLTNATYGSVTLDVLLDNNTPITTWALIESNLSSGVDYPAYGSAVYNNEPYVYNHAQFNFTTNKVTLTFIGYWTVPDTGTIWKQLNSDWSSSQITISDIIE